MPRLQPQSPPRDPADAAAARWFILRDRGLSHAEQAAYRQWMQEDPRHLAAMARVEKLWITLDPVFAGHANAGRPPDADLLAPARRGRRWWWIPAVAAAAAAALVLLQPKAQHPAPLANPARAIYHPGPERLPLPDGSIVELAAGAKVEVQFTADERRVRLVHGTAFFTVAKNPSRPFVVSTSEVSVRAVGTAFSVALDPQTISVLVTEGRVRVQERSASTTGQVLEARDLSALDAGQQGVIHRTRSDRWEISVNRLTPAEIERVMAWQGARLEFADLPLEAVVAEFNRYSSGKKLVIGDAPTGAIRVGGNFRADRVDGFLRALDAGFNVSAIPHGDEFILRERLSR